MYNYTHLCRHIHIPVCIYICVCVSHHTQVPVPEEDLDALGSDTVARALLAHGEPRSLRELAALRLDKLGVTHIDMCVHTH